MEDVSRRIVNEMASCIKANVEGANRPASPAGDSPGQSEAPPQQVTAPPINAVSLFFQVLWTGIRRAFGGKPN